MADLLENLGVASDQIIYTSSLNIIKDSIHQKEYIALVQNGAAPLDVGG